MKIGYGIAPTAGKRKACKKADRRENRRDAYPLSMNGIRMRHPEVLKHKNLIIVYYVWNTEICRML